MSYPTTGREDMPTWEEVFDKPTMSTCAVECPDAWQGDSIAVMFADRECERLIVNATFNPPITEKEIERYSRQFKMPKRQAELKIREGRETRDGYNQKAAA